jgi:hypothetical protein
MEAASFFIVFVETDLDCSQRDKNNKKDTADSRIQLLKKNYLVTNLLSVSMMVPHLSQVLSASEL